MHALSSFKKDHCQGHGQKVTLIDSARKLPWKSKVFLGSKICCVKENSSAIIVFSSDEPEIFKYRARKIFRTNVKNVKRASFNYV